MTTNLSSTAYGAATEGQMGLVNGTNARALARAGQATAPASTEVGHVIKATGSSTNIGTFDTYGDITNLTVTLTTGTWVCIASGTFAVSATSPAGGIVTNDHVFNFDGSESGQPYSWFGSKITTTPISEDALAGTFQIVGSYTVASGTKVLKVRQKVTAYGGGATGGGITTRAGSLLLAVRVA